MKIKHFIWDFDGTLLNTYPAMVKAFYKTCQDYKFPADEDIILEKMKISLQTVLDYYSHRFTFPPSFLNDFQKNRDLIEKQEVEPYSDTKSILEQIQLSGNFNYVVTHRGESTMELLNQHQLEHYFIEVIMKEKGFERKPSPDSINYLIKKYELNRDETIMIGDRIQDIEAGRAAGIHTCFFDELRSGDMNKAELVISRLSELEQVVSWE